MIYYIFCIQFSFVLNSMENYLVMSLLAIIMSVIKIVVVEQGMNLSGGSKNKFNFKLTLAVSKENEIFQIAKKPIRDGRLVLPDLKNEFC
jgi:hypothetical protein